MHGCGRYDFGSDEHRSSHLRRLRLRRRDSERSALPRSSGQRQIFAAVSDPLRFHQRRREISPSRNRRHEDSMKLRRTIRRNEEGVAAIEMAFALPILIVMIWMFVQLAQIYRAMA